MKRLAVIPACIAIAFLVRAVMAPHFSGYGRVSRAFHLFGWLFVLAVIMTAAVFWVVTIAELLHARPGTQREWWLASLAVVVVLGPLGAVAYKLAAPSFAYGNDEPLHRD